jgi:uncharacterized membrane protein
MQKFNLKQEFVLWALIAMPLVYLVCMWKTMPETVPVHFNIDGVADSWGSKTTYIWVASGPAVAIYVILLWTSFSLPQETMQGFFNTPIAVLRLMLQIWLGIISADAVYSASGGTMAGSVRFIMAPVFLGFAILGEYLEHLKFLSQIGINLPWTMNSETVWKQAHLGLGRFFLYGGLLCFVLSFLLTTRNVTIMFFVFGAVTVAALVIYPWFLYRREERRRKEGNS